MRFALALLLTLALPMCCSADSFALKVMGVGSLAKPEQQFLQDCEAALAMLASKSPKAHERLEVYRRHSVPASWQRPGTVVPTRSMPTQQPIYVVPDVVDSISTEGTSIAAVFNYQTDTIFLRANQLSPLLRGLILAHELVHAERHVVDGAPEPEPYSREWRREEAAACLIVDSILDEYTNKGWSTVAWEALTRRQGALSPNRQYAGHVQTLDSHDLVALATLFPDLPREQVVHLTRPFLVALNLRKIASESEEFNLGLMAERIQLLIGSIWAAP